MRRTFENSCRGMITILIVNYVMLLQKNIFLYDVEITGTCISRRNLITCGTASCNAVCTSNDCNCSIYTKHICILACARHSGRTGGPYHNLVCIIWQKRKKPVVYCFYCLEAFDNVISHRLLIKLLAKWIPATILKSPFMTRPLVEGPAAAELAEMAER